MLKLNGLLEAGGGWEGPDASSSTWKAGGELTRDLLYNLLQ